MAALVNFVALIHMKKAALYKRLVAALLIRILAYLS